MKVTPTDLPGVAIVEPRVIRDERGFFLEAFNADRFAEHGLPTVYRQDNHSRSLRNVIRGLHYQVHRPQGRLVMAVRGRVFDVAVDVRRGSPTFGRWYGTVLDEEQPRLLWIPPGFAHGFCTLSDEAHIVYKCTETYSERHARGVLWSDPAIGIAWPVSAPILSHKDRALPILHDSRTELPDFLS